MTGSPFLRGPATRRRGDRPRREVVALYDEWGQRGAVVAAEGRTYYVGADGSNARAAAKQIRS